MEHDDHNEDDATQVIAARTGDREAFDLLLGRHYPSVVRRCQRMLGSPDEAHDVAQEAALQVFLSLHRLQQPTRFGAWFHAIAANLARKTLRRRRALSLEALAADPALAALMLADPATPDAAFA